MSGSRRSSRAATPEGEDVNVPDVGQQLNTLIQPLTSSLELITQRMDQLLQRTEALEAARVDPPRGDAAGSSSAAAASTSGEAARVLVWKNFMKKWKLKNMLDLITGVSPPKPVKAGFSTPPARRVVMLEDDPSDDESIEDVSGIYAARAKGSPFKRDINSSIEPRSNLDLTKSKAHALWTVVCGHNKAIAAKHEFPILYAALSYLYDAKVVFDRTDLQTLPGELIGAINTTIGVYQLLVERYSAVQLNIERLNKPANSLEGSMARLMDFKTTVENQTATLPDGQSQRFLAESMSNMMHHALRDMIKAQATDLLKGTESSPSSTQSTSATPKKGKGKPGGGKPDKKE